MGAMQLMSFSMNHVLCIVQGDNMENQWTCSGVYGWLEAVNKRKTWSLLKFIHRVIDQPWLV